jgi:hypothetical protein
MWQLYPVISVWTADYFENICLYPITPTQRPVCEAANHRLELGILGCGNWETIGYTSKQ